MLEIANGGPRKVAALLSSDGLDRTPEGFGGSGFDLDEHQRFPILCQKVDFVPADPQSPGQNPVALFLQKPFRRTLPPTPNPEMSGFGDLFPSEQTKNEP